MSVGDDGGSHLCGGFLDPVPGGFQGLSSLEFWSRIMFMVLAMHIRVREFRDFGVLECLRVESPHPSWS